MRSNDLESEIYRINANYGQPTRIVEEANRNDIALVVNDFTSFVSESKCSYN